MVKFTTVKLICDVCNKEFYKRTGDYNRAIKDGKDKFFCSQKCVAKFKSNNIKYNDVFSEMSEELAYFLGVLFTDGWITDTVLGLEIHINDLDVIEKFKSWLGTESKISFTERNSARIQIRSKKIVEVFSNYGLIPRKSLILSPPIIDDKFLRHFWRGCLDGDGCIMIKYKLIHYCGSYNMVNGFINYCKKLTDTKTSARQKGNIYETSLTGKNACIILKNIYENTSVFMNRKYELSNQFIKLF